MRRIHSYSTQQELMHMHHGQVDKCIDVMCDLIHHASDDNDLTFQAKNGLLKKDIKVPDSEWSTKDGRKLFMINLLCSSVSLKNQFVDTSVIAIHILANFRCFSFHLSQIDKQFLMLDLMNRTLAEEKQLDDNGEHICLCACSMKCGHSENCVAYSKCRCRKGIMQPTT
ncbi:hypothetical protein ACQ26_gp17 [Vibrio phage PV94]|uniref:hypothetical protein n=1 Tax=Vibrio phage PV94 TaxID=1451050 RepID=UPI0018A860C9|nr:hypothetical protein ACQ26_gp17 [Vibrio phage PV94]